MCKRTYKITFYDSSEANAEGEGWFLRVELWSSSMGIYFSIYIAKKPRILKVWSLIRSVLIIDGHTRHVKAEIIAQQPCITVVFMRCSIGRWEMRVDNILYTNFLNI